MNSLLQSSLKQKILPAVVFKNAEDALPVAEIFAKAGLYVMEVPYRTATASKAIKVIRKNFPEICVGAGTLLSPDYLQMAIDAGAQFGLSSGFNMNVCREAARQNFPFIPGVMTPSEMEAAHTIGCSIQKLFPAEQLGGPSFLKAMLGPYEHINLQFIPMGGVNILNMENYLTLKNVIAVGGSWLATDKLISDHNYKGIEKNIEEVLKHCVNKN